MVSAVYHIVYSAGTFFYPKDDKFWFSVTVNAGAKWHESHHCTFLTTEHVDAFVK